MEGFAEVKNLDNNVEPQVSKMPYTLKFPKRGLPTLMVPPLKRKDRAQAKYKGWRDLKPATRWPPEAAEITDLLRATLVFDDPYDLVACLEYLKTVFVLQRVANRFANFSKTMRKQSGIQDPGGRGMQLWSNLGGLVLACIEVDFPSKRV